MSWQFTPIVGDRDIERNFRSLQAYLAALAAAPAQVVLAADASANNSGALLDVAGLAFGVAADSRYAFEFYLALTGTTANGVQVALTCPVGATLLAHAVIPTAADGTAANTEGTITASGDTVTATTLATSPVLVRVSGTLQTGATAGTLQVQLAPRVSGGAGVTPKAGSCGLLYTLT
jgi:hypothetical protein